MEVLFTFLADRYEQGSLMITSNLPFSKWEQIFKEFYLIGLGASPRDLTHRDKSMGEI